MTTNKSTARLVAAALASVLAIGSAAAPALAFAETQTPVDDAFICPQSYAISATDAGVAAASWIGWSWADVDYVTTTLVYDVWGNPDYYVVDISAFFTSDIYTVYVDAYTGAIL